MNRFFRWAAIGMAFLLFFGTMTASAVQSDAGKSFKIEIYGGWNALHPSDLNLMVETDKTVQDVMFDRYYTQTFASYPLRHETNGELLPLRHAPQAGLRAIWQFHSRWALMLGLENAFRTQISSASYLYAYDYQPTAYSMRDRKEFLDYRVGAWAWSALIGLRYEAPRLRRMSIGGSLSAGLSRLGCRIMKEWRWRFETSVNSELRQAFEQSGRSEMEGSGWGLAADAGLRLGWRLSPRWTLFCEGGYALRRSGAVSGSEKETIDTDEQTFSGRWKVVTETIMNSSWASATDIRYPMIDPGRAYEQKNTRSDFKLDLSGFQLRLGISFTL